MSRESTFTYSALMSVIKDAATNAKMLFIFFEINPPYNRIINHNYSVSLGPVLQLFFRLQSCFLL